MSQSLQRLAPHIPQLLKHTRTERALTLEAIHRRTRIPVRALEALEENDLSYFSAPVYMYGFLEQYCEYLELDYQQVLTPAQEEQPDEQELPPEPPPPQPGKIAPPQATRVLETKNENIAVPQGDLFVRAEILPSPPPAAQAKKPAQHHPAPVKQKPHYASDSFSASEPPDPVFRGNDSLGFEDFHSSMNGNVMRMLLVSIIGCAISVMWLWRNASSFSQAEQETQARNAQQYNQLYESTFVSTLKASFTKRTWLRVDADGTVVFEGFAQEGDMKEWKAARNFDVRTTTPATLSMTIDNKPIKAEVFSSSHTIIPVTFTGSTL